MTLPYEEVNALKSAREHMRDLLGSWRSKKFLLGLLFSKKKREQMVKQTYYCLKHYPADYVIERRWGEEATPEGWDKKHLGKNNG